MVSILTPNFSGIKNNEKSLNINPMLLPRRKIAFASYDRYYRLMKEALSTDKRQETPVIIHIKDSIDDFVKKISLISQKAVISIGAAGETCSGKTFFKDRLVKIVREAAGEQSVTELDNDSYYKDFSHLVKEKGGFEEALRSGYSLDIPCAYNLSLYGKNLKTLQLGLPVKKPLYIPNNTGISEPEAIPVNPAKLIVSEGLFNLHPEVRDAFDLKFYVESSEKVRIKRWLNRAQNAEAAEIHFKDTKAKADEHIKPTRQFADAIISGEASVQSLQSLVSGIYRALQVL